MNRLHPPGFAAVKGRGFTLIELMVSVVIVAILASLALPAYRQYIIRAKRSAAQVQMMDIASREEQFLLANRTYADKAALVANGYTLASEVALNYTYDVTTVSSGSVPSYTITFTAINGQLSDGDLALTSTGVKSPAGKW